MPTPAVSRSSTTRRLVCDILKLTVRFDGLCYLKVLFRFSILRTFRLLRVFRAFRYSNTVILTSEPMRSGLFRLGVSSFLAPSSVEVMRISIKLSQDALLALAFFILMVLIIFST